MPFEKGNSFAYKPGESGRKPAPGREVVVRERASGLPPKLASGVRYWARRTFQYTEQVPLDRGQVLTLIGAPNDEKLVRLGYVALLDSNQETYVCSDCGGEFVGLGERTGHARERHMATRYNPYEEDAHLDARERREQELAPLYLEKTAASQKG